MKNIREHFKKNDGFSYPLAAVIIIVFLTIILSLIEIYRLNIITTQVSKKFENAIISLTTINYKQNYQPLREGTASSYVFDDDEMDWIKIDNIAKEDVYKELDSSFTEKEHEQVKIKSIDYNVEAGSVDNIDKTFSLNGKIVVTIQSKFPGYNGEIEIPIIVKSTWNAKFQ